MKPEIDFENQPVMFVQGDTPPPENYTGVLIKMAQDGSMQNGPDFHKVKHIFQYKDGILDGDAYTDRGNENYSIINYKTKGDNEVNNYEGGSASIREFREADYEKDPESILDEIKFDGNQSHSQGYNKDDLQRYIEAEHKKAKKQNNKLHRGPKSYTVDEVIKAKANHIRR